MKLYRVGRGRLGAFGRVQRFKVVRNRSVVVPYKPMTRAEIIDFCARFHRPLPKHFYEDQTPEVVEAIKRYESKSDPRDNRFELRLSNKEKESAVELATVKGVSVAELLRSLLTEAIEGVGK